MGTGSVYRALLRGPEQTTCCWVRSSHTRIVLSAATVHASPLQHTSICVSGTHVQVCA